jgi:hypothetical protein
MLIREAADVSSGGGLPADSGYETAISSTECASAIRPASLANASPSSPSWHR